MSRAGWKTFRTKRVPSLLEKDAFHRPIPARAFEGVQKA